MSRRLAAFAFPLTIIAALAACQSSAPYGTTGHAAVATGLAVAAGAANRAAGQCWAQCLQGTVCNPANGMCVPEHRRPSPAPTAPNAAPAVAPSGHHPLTATASYPPGHEYSVPPTDGADAGCNPSSSDQGGISCEMDASVPH
ncbi:Hypothetical protein A7982_09311 [Minicystis rosea]|nr:Hypothetical protein A7982_09311 [Minicystis rosea]